MRERFQVDGDLADLAATRERQASGLTLRFSKCFFFLLVYLYLCLCICIWSEEAGKQAYTQDYQMFEIAFNCLKEI